MVGKAKLARQPAPELTLRARALLPVCAPPVHDGALHIRNGRIVQVARWRDVRSSAAKPVIDLGDVLLLPGLINAHCHLDYTHMAGQLPPQKSFTDWLKLIVGTKAGWSLEDYRSSWKAGAQMLVRHGVTTVADIEAVPQLLPDVWDSTPLRVFSFLELIGISERRPAAAVVADALQVLANTKARAFRLGLSPHAPYSTTSELLRLAGTAARREKLLLSTHIAESQTELEMFQKARGEMFDWLQRSGRCMADCGGVSPVHHSVKTGALPSGLLAVHVNYLSRGDARLLRAVGASVAHCPRSHFYFKHAPFPLRSLSRAGVNLCLGTDSLASVYKRHSETVELDLFAEMRVFREAHPALSARALLRMCTVNAARALLLSGEAGQLAKKALADAIAIPLKPGVHDLYEAVLAHQGPVSCSMIAGRWAIEPQTA